MQKNVAQWRFEQISPLLDTQISPSERSRLVKELSSLTVRWPNGQEKSIGESTLYSWYQKYTETHELSSLENKPHSAHKKDQPTILPEWVVYGITLLEESPYRSVSFLAKMIEIKYALAKKLPQSSFRRSLIEEPRYASIVLRRQNSHKIRTRFEAFKAHYIWYCDAKGSFVVKFENGDTKRVVVMSILDDKTRAVLAAIIVETESTKNAAQVFINAASRWNLCEKFYSDRGSCYDSDIFRRAMANLGVHRIWTKARNPEAHGKIEAYHRFLKSWFVKELNHQVVKDMTHLQQLLTAFIEVMYQNHYHRTIRMTPAEALKNEISSRKTTSQELYDAFFDEKHVYPVTKSGEVFVDSVSYLVPERYLRVKQRVFIQWNILQPTVVFLYDEKEKKRIPLSPAVTIAGNENTPLSIDEVEAQPLPAGSLSQLIEIYRGRTLPLAQAGFGLHEIYTLFSEVLQRCVPQTESEGKMIQLWLQEYGPLKPEGFIYLIKCTIVTENDKNRPMKYILDTMTKFLERKRHDDENEDN